MWSHWRNAYSWQVWTNYFQCMSWESIHSFFEIRWTLQPLSTVLMLPILCMTLEIKSKYKLIYELFPPLYFILKEKKKNTTQQHEEPCFGVTVLLCLFSILLLWRWDSSAWSGSKEKTTVAPQSICVYFVKSDSSLYWFAT